MQRREAIRGLAAVAGTVGALAVFNGIASAKERHPHIHKAIEELREARKELKEADHDFGGHREMALRATDGKRRVDGGRQFVFSWHPLPHGRGSDRSHDRKGVSTASLQGSGRLLFGLRLLLLRY